LMEDKSYAQRNREMASINTRRRRKERKTSGEVNDKTAQLNSRKNKAQKNAGKRQILTAKQKYWRRRVRLLATGKERQIDLILKQRMAEQSDISTFDADLIFAKASYAERKSIRTLKYQHTETAKQVITAITRTENGNCLTEADLDAIFGNRQHSSNSESYYWEQTYHIFDCKEVIPIDSYGQAHIFPPMTQKNATFQSMPTPDADVEPDTDVVLEQSTISAPQITAGHPLLTSAVQQPPSDVPATSQSRKVTRWTCNRGLCKIDQQSIDSISELLQKLATTTPARCLHLYLNINKCLYTDKNPYKLGHSLSCSVDNGCHSLLKHLRAVSSHFPAARTMSAAIYKLRRLSLCIRAVQQAKHSGDFKHLQLAITSLKEAQAAFGGSVNQDSGTVIDEGTATTTNDEITETSIISKFGKQLRQVAEERDTYVTTACALCEQLKPNLKTLSSLQRRKGFDSKKMTDA